jgi:hypothetical protein
VYQIPDDPAWPGFEPPLPPLEGQRTPVVGLFSPLDPGKSSSSPPQGSGQPSSRASDLIDKLSQIRKKSSQSFTTTTAVSASTEASSTDTEAGGLGIKFGISRSSHFSEDINKEIRRKSSTKLDMAKVAAVNFQALKNQNSFDRETSHSGDSRNLISIVQELPRLEHGGSFDQGHNSISRLSSSTVESFRPNSPTRTTYDGDDYGELQLLPTPRVGEAFNSPAISGPFHISNSEIERASSLFFRTDLGSSHTTRKSNSCESASQDVRQAHTQTFSTQQPTLCTTAASASPPCPTRPPPPTPIAAPTGFRQNLTPSQIQRAPLFQDAFNATRTPVNHEKHPSIIDSTPNTLNSCNELDPAYIGSINLEDSDELYHPLKSRIPGPNKSLSPLGCSKRKAAYKPNGRSSPLSGSPRSCKSDLSPLTNSLGTGANVSGPARNGRGGLPPRSAHRFDESQNDNGDDVTPITGRSRNIFRGGYVGRRG